VCGITGFWAKEKAREGLALQMAGLIQTRGPDDAGDWHSKDGSLALAHRRLSIVDLSPAGHQPMVSDCQQHVLAFNGEIYNHEDLRKEIESELGAIQWRGHSDTEVLLYGLRHWGLELTLSKLNGMFAFAYWSERDKSLFLARDRMGEKPLYFGRQNGTFLFGSELKALKAHPSFSSDIDRDALALYMRHNYIPAPYSIYQNIHKLKPAHYVVISNHRQNISEQRCYWDLKEVANDGLANQVTDEQQALADLDSLLKDSVKRRMMADVPLGAFLSGGYDSTTVAALMQAQSTKSVKTFSIGFKEDLFNEAHYAKQVAKHLGTEHTEFYVEPQQAIDVIPELPEIYDEPFSDASQIPTFLVSQLAKRHVSVALSGDGGDELFCGYGRYFIQRKRWQWLSNIPRPIKPGLAKALLLASSCFLNGSQSDELSRASLRSKKLADWLEFRDFNSFYLRSVSHFSEASNIVLGSNPLNTAFDSTNAVFAMLSSSECMMLLDSLTYLPDDILTKVDRASMAVSLEARVPLLDHRLVEYAWRVPFEMKVKNEGGKWPLRQVLYKYVPKDMMERPKQGFGVPISQWLRGPLRDWAEHLLDERVISEQGYLSPEVVRKMWAEHISGKYCWQSQLWNVLMFQAWLNKWV
jgi:asparagine synthase (glutamine-hydrolysing)